MTELEITIQFAKAWNNLDIAYIEPYLSEDFHYASQWVFDEITTKEEYLSYLDGKFNSIKQSIESGDSILNAEIGYYVNKPCLILLQLHNDPKDTGAQKRKLVNGKVEWENVKSKAIETVLLIEFGNNKIIRADMCMIPTANEVQRTGEIPV